MEPGNNEKSKNKQEKEYEDGWYSPPQQVNLTLTNENYIKSLLSGTISDITTGAQNLNVGDMVCNYSFTMGHVKTQKGNLEVIPLEKKVKACKRPSAAKVSSKSLSHMPPKSNLREGKPEIPPQTLEINVQSPLNGIIHGNFKLNHIPIYFNQTNLHESIREQLTLEDIKDMTKSQKYSIPAILEKNNFLLVSDASDKREFGCILPLLSLVLQEHKYQNDYIIRCLIVCPSIIEVEDYGKMCQNYASKLNILEICTSSDELFTQVLHGYDVVLTTPDYCVDLFQLCHEIPRKLNHVLFIDADHLFPIYKPEMEAICNQIYTVPELQLVFIANIWSDCLNDISSKLNLVVCTTSYVEALVYLNITPELQYAVNKCSKLLDIVKENHDKRMAIFGTDKEIIIIENYLHEMNINTQNTNKTDIEFKLKPKHILLCTDKSEIDLKITNVELLINYSLPDTMKIFSNRLKLTTDYLSKETKDKLSIKVIYDSQFPLPTIHKFLNKLKIPEPEEMQEIFKGE